MVPGIIGAHKQTIGNGCVYPPATGTLPAQLTAAHHTWRAYIQSMGDGPPGSQQVCRHPPLGGTDPDQTPGVGDPYVTWSNPFVYFRSLIDKRSCAKDDVGLPRLASDLRAKSRTPSFAYIVPDACHDGSDQPCAPGAAAGLAATNSFLHSVVPEIERSPAYKVSGLIAITFDEAPQTGPYADSSACCATPTYPNVRRGRRASPGGHNHDPGTDDRPHDNDALDSEHDDNYRQQPGQHNDHNGPDDNNRSHNHSHHQHAPVIPRTHYPDRRRRSGRSSADLPLRQARQSRRHRLLQPLLAAGEHRAPLQAAAPRLCEEQAALGVRQLRL